MRDDVGLGERRTVGSDDERGEALAAHYASADLFLFPSQSETFGNVTLEALASGLPVAAYPVTGPRDILTNRDCAAMDVDLGAAVAKALTLDRAAARTHALTFTWTACAGIFLDTLVPVREQLAAAA